MKAKYILIFIVIIWGRAAFSQITTKQADNIVASYIEKEITDYYWLYSLNSNVNQNQKEGVGKIVLWYDESLTVKEPSYIYFIDEAPYANWEHPSRYLFVNKITGKYEVVKKKTPPKNLGEWTLLTPISGAPKEEKFDFSKIRSTNRQNIQPQNCYAVIISGGADLYNNHVRYWNDCSAIYSALVNVYGYSDDHIYVIMADGTSPDHDRRHPDGSTDSSPLDLDLDGDNDIQYAASRSNITAVFDHLSTILTPNDQLFVFTTDHGGDDFDGKGAYLVLWNFEKMYASEFATEADKIKANNICVTMEQCYSGGFVKPLEKLGRVIATACADDELSWAGPTIYYDEFVYHWISAIAGFTPTGASVNADYNNDGVISMEEAFMYAQLNDKKTETPQYSSTYTDLGSYLTLLGEEACSTTYITNQAITSAKTIYGCDIYIDNSSITNNATVSITADSRVTIKPATHFKEGTKVIIKIRGIYNTYSLGSVRSASSIQDIEEVSSIEETVIAIGNNVKFYPNPTDGILNFECSDVGVGCNVKIYSISGQLVYSNGVQRNGDVIDLSTLAKGMYLAKVTVGGETITQKIILK